MDQLVNKENYLKHLIQFHTIPCTTKRSTNTNEVSVLKNQGKFQYRDHNSFTMSTQITSTTKLIKFNYYKIHKGLNVFIYFIHYQVTKLYYIIFKQTSQILSQSE